MIIEKTPDEIQQSDDIFRNTFSLITAATTQDKNREIFDRIQIVLKLFKSQVVLSPAFFANSKPTHLTYYILYGDEIERYIIEPSEVIDFIDFWSKYRKIPTNNFAVRKFHQLDFRPKLDDRYVDAIIGLEYFFNTDIHEISYQFRTLGTLVLGENLPPDKKRKLFQFLREAYNTRSKLVHGDNSPKIDKSKLTKVRDLLRDAIKYFYSHDCLDNKTERTDLLNNKLLGI